MPRPGQAFLQADALDARATTPCDGCGHELGEHRELPPTRAVIDDGALVEVPTPGYQPWHFHCGIDGCVCVRVAA